jgi:putative DNA primase/helicase
MGIVGIDIDHCITDGQTNEEARRIITALDSYAETSPSGTGIRIMLEAKLPGAFRRHGNIEMYEDMRYLSLTGHSLTNTPQDIQPRHRELYGLYHRLFQVQENTGGVLGCAQVLNTSLSGLMKPCCKKH